MTTLEAAIEYVTKFGWSVFPVKPDKKPYTPNGCKDAKKDLGAINAWWKKWPDALVGVATGSASNLIVIDEDIDEDKGLNGYHEVLRWEKEHEPLPETVQSITGRGGYHLFYHYTGSDIGNRAGVLDGVDVRGEGGYIIAPPSKHPNGNEYQWEYSPDDIKIADLNDTVRAFVTIGKNADGDHFNLPDMIKDGVRNDTLFKLASSLQAKGIPDEGILATLQSVNKTNCETPLQDDELKRILRSVTKFEKGEVVKPKEKPKRKLRKLKTAEGLMEKDIPEPQVFVGVGDELPFLVEGTCILSAKPKLGKSWFALALCIAISNGEDFLGYKTQKKSVLYLDLETSEPIQKKRLLKVLKGKPVPTNFYLETETDALDHGLLDQLEYYIKQDNDLGVIVFDVFQMIRSAAKNFKESEYDHAYRDITPLNEFAQRNHVSIILVCHDRKTVDPDDPFSNILGSTGLQGAVSQMIVMYRKHKGDPIHISTKGKTIDGVIDMNVQLDKAEWSKVDYDPDDESNQLELEYQESQIRKAVIEIAKRSGDAGWKGRCSWIIQESVEYDVPIVESAKQVGGFLHRHQGRFLANDGVKISIINNGSGAKTYKICQSTVDTVDENEALTVDGFEKADNYGEYEIPFV